MNIWKLSHNYFNNNTLEKNLKELVSITLVSCVRFPSDN